MASSAISVAAVIAALRHAADPWVPLPARGVRTAYDHPSPADPAGPNGARESLRAGGCTVPLARKYGAHDDERGARRADASVSARVKVAARGEVSPHPAAAPLTEPVDITEHIP